MPNILDSLTCLSISISENRTLGDLVKPWNTENYVTYWYKAFRRFPGNEPKCQVNLFFRFDSL